MAAFSGTKLAEVKFNEGLEEIGRNAFAKIPTLKNIELPNSLKRIEQGAFSASRKEQNQNLPGKINFGPNLEYVGNNVFQYCTGLGEYTIE